MANSSLRCLHRAVKSSSSLLKSSLLNPFSPRLVCHNPRLIWQSHNPQCFSEPSSPSFLRKLSYGTVNLVISQGKPKFEVEEVDPPKKHKWLTKKRLKMQRMREKKKRNEANRRDPRRLTVKRKKQKFANVEDRIKDKLEKARIKEALLVERLKKYEVPKVQGPIVKPHELTGEEKFYFKKMAQKRSNYVPVGRRGVFGGVILNMHLHWKKHETVKVFFKPCKPGQIDEYIQEIERLSGGVAIQVIGEDTAIFYRGKNYVRPEVMSPCDTLSKKKALEKSKYEQSLETVRHFIAVTEKELELYYRHIALYGAASDNRNCDASDTNTQRAEIAMNKSVRDSAVVSETEYDSIDEELSITESESEPEPELESESESASELDTNYVRNNYLESDISDSATDPRIAKY